MCFFFSINLLDMIDKFFKLQKYVEELCQRNNIKIKQSEKHLVLQQIAIYFDSLIFNTVSIICLISVLNNSHTLNSSTLEVSAKYIESKCNFYYNKVNTSMTGGSRLGSATFMGAYEPMYNENNTGSDVLSVNFNTGEARPQIGGKGNKISNIITSYINGILKYHGIKAETNIKNQINELIKVHIDCLLHQLKLEKKDLTVNRLNKIVTKNHIFRPLK